jgi:uncharacterized protein YPO0396
VSEFIAPALALLGTLLVAALGFYQWKKQSANPNRNANAAARREAYDGLWKRLEEINLELRRTRDGVPSLTEQLRSINEYFIAHSIYFDDADQTLIDKYVHALHYVRSAIDKTEDESAKKNYHMTGAFDPKPIQDLVSATDEMEKYRAIIKEKARKIVDSD